MEIYCFTQAMGRCYLRVEVLIDDTSWQWMTAKSNKT